MDTLSHSQAVSQMEEVISAVKGLPGYPQWHSEVATILQGWGYSEEDSKELTTNLNYHFQKGWDSQSAAEQMDSMAESLNPAG
jgi:hypothetical protein